jgi:hypothetical protein
MAHLALMPELPIDFTQAFANPQEIQAWLNDLSRMLARGHIKVAWRVTMPS